MLIDRLMEHDGSINSIEEYNGSVVPITCVSEARGFGAKGAITIGGALVS